MSTQLVDREMQYAVDHFRLLMETEEETVPLDRLLDETFLSSFLDEVKDELGTTNVFVAASQFVKRLGYVMTVPAFYLMTRYNKQITINLSNSCLVLKQTNDKWMPHLLLKDSSAKVVDNACRQTHYQEFARQLFNHMAKIIDKVSAVASVPKPILWENVAIYVYWLYEIRLRKDGGSALTPQIEADFYELLHKLPGSVFGEAYNPLKKFFSEKKEKPGTCEQIRIRRTCCFYYKTEADGKYCTTCPKNKQASVQ